jgi:TolA-binding protein
LFKIDSEWKIEAVSAGKSKDAAAASAKRYLPPVTVIYTGKLKDLGTAEPMVSVTELEREINVRRMERDVEELERLRKSDQQRAAQTAQRQKALEAEQARKAPATAPSDSIAPPGPGSALPNDGAPPVSEDATLNTDAANAAAAEGASTASPAPRPAVRKKRPETGWQPFQVTPY